MRRAGVNQKGILSAALVRPDPVRWDTFITRYREELAAQEPVWQERARRARKGRVTLLYAAKDPQRNNAVVLRSFLAEK
jgi:uncharacterized protein YeaO (DUF488 family)